MIQFDGGRVVVTGAAGGIGRALVETLHACGAEVVACDRPGADLSDPAIGEAHHFDLRDGEAVERAAADIAAGGVPAALVSNAGGTAADTLDEVTDAALDAELDLNFRSVARLTQAMLPGMRGREAGAAIVVVSSVNALMHFGNPAYSGAKAALLAWMRAIATEEGKNGIRANAVLPGSTRTPAWDRRIARNPDVLEGVRRLYPLGRLVAPEEVARAAAFLASPAASGITGASLAVDGGVTGGNLPFVSEIAP